MACEWTGGLGSNDACLGVLSIDGDRLRSRSSSVDEALRCHAGGEESYVQTRVRVSVRQTNLMVELDEIVVWYCVSTRDDYKQVRKVTVSAARHHSA